MTATTTLTGSFSHQSWEYEKPAPGGIVVGVDGSKESIAALNTAAAIARVRGCPVHAVTVIPPFPSYQINPGVDVSRESIEQLRINLRKSELRDIVNCLEPKEDWTTDVMVGRPARELTIAAHDRNADLIIVGRSIHGIMDRILGGETSLQVMRLAVIPVLSVPADADLPKRIVVATDFSPSSMRAARVALELLGPTGTMYLVYVEQSAELLPNGFALPGEARFPGDVVAWFRRMIAGLGARPGVTIESIFLNGKPVAAVSEFAERVGADLIAAGAHGHTRMERFLIGSVSAGLVRTAQCPVLVAPPGD
jgi:nucleotide-binding universal stress UspA family protein